MEQLSRQHMKGLSSNSRVKKVRTVGLTNRNHGILSVGDTNLLRNISGRRVRFNPPAIALKRATST